MRGHFCLHSESAKCAPCHHARCLMAQTNDAHCGSFGQHLLLSTSPTAAVRWLGIASIDAMDFNASNCQTFAPLGIRQIQLQLLSSTLDWFALYKRAVWEISLHNGINATDLAGIILAPCVPLEKDTWLPNKCSFYTWKQESCGNNVSYRASAMDSLNITKSQFIAMHCGLQQSWLN